MQSTKNSTNSRNKKIIIYVILGLAIVISLIIIFIPKSPQQDSLSKTEMQNTALANALNQAGNSTIPGALSADDQTIPLPDFNSAEQYQNEYGGKLLVYEQILASDDCQYLVDQYNNISQYNGLQAFGSEKYDWSLGYMTAIKARVQEISCY